MAAYAALVSLMQIIENLKLHPISHDHKQVGSLIEKVNSLQEFLEGYNPNSHGHPGDTETADPLESRIANAVYEAEDIIESHIVDQITKRDGENINSEVKFF